MDRPPSPPLLVLALGVLLGDLLAPLVATPASVLGLAAAGLFACALPARRIALPALFSAGLCLGCSLVARLDPPLAGLPPRVRAVVTGSAQGHEADVIVTAVAETGGPWSPAFGRLRVRFPDAAPAPGVPFVAGGAAHRLARFAPPGELTGRWAAARAHVSAVLVAKDVIALGPDPAPSPAVRLVHAGLVSAMAGRPATVPPAEKLVLQRTGTWHLIAVSGMQVGLVAGAAWGIVRLLGRPLALVWHYGGLRWPAAVAACAAAAVFTWASGSPPSAVRATLMAGAVALGRAAGLQVGAWEGLALALCGTLVLDPNALDRLGFQLSFAAIAGIVLWSHRVTRWVPLDAPRLLRALATSLGGTLGATLGTLPIVALQFQTLSPLAPLTNLLVGPLLGGCATPAAVAGFALAPVWPRLAGVLLTVADTATDLALRVLAPLDVDPWHPAVGPLGAGLLLLAALTPRRPLWTAGLLTAALALRWPFPPADGRLVVQFLAVGQGDGAIISFPDGRVWAVDAGPSPGDMLAILRRQGILHLDRVILTHPHPDHFGGLQAVLENLVVDELVVPRAPRWSGPGSGESERTYARLLGLAGRVDFAELPAPATLLHPFLGWTSAAHDPVNDESIVFRLDFGRRRFLFTGDVEAAGERELLDHHAAALRADVLKVPHHGSRTSSSWPFVTAVNPLIAVFSCGEENRFRHPNPAALAHYRGRRVYRTDRDGTIVVSTDGVDLEVDRPDLGGMPIDADPVPRPAPPSTAERLAQILLDP